MNINSSQATGGSMMAAIRSQAEEYNNLHGDENDRNLQNSGERDAVAGSEDFKQVQLIDQMIKFDKSGKGCKNCEDVMTIGQDKVEEEFGFRFHEDDVSVVKVVSHAFHES